MSYEIWENFPQINFWPCIFHILFFPRNFYVEHYGAYVTEGKMGWKDQELITVKMSFLC